MVECNIARPAVMLNSNGRERRTAKKRRRDCWDAGTGNVGGVGDERVIVVEWRWLEWRFGDDSWRVRQACDGMRNRGKAQLMVVVGVFGGGGWTNRLENARRRSRKVDG